MRLKVSLAYIACNKYDHPLVDTLAETAAGCWTKLSRGVNIEKLKGRGWKVYPVTAVFDTIEPGLENCNTSTQNSPISE